MVIEKSIEQVLAKTCVSIKDALSDEYEEGSKVYIFSIIGDCTEEETKNNKPYWNLTVSDATGVTTLKIWADKIIDPKTAMKRVYNRGNIVLLRAVKSSFNGSAQLNFDGTLLVSDTFEELYEHEDDRIDDLVKSISRAYEVDGHTVYKIFEERHNLSLDHRIIFDRVFGIAYNFVGEHYLDMIRGIDPDQSVYKYADQLADSSLFESDEAVDRFKRFVTAPAAKGYHGNFIHGNMVHALTLHDLSISIRDRYTGCGVYPLDGSDKVDWDAISLACIIHDFFKIDEYEWESYGNISGADMSTTYSHSMRMFSLLESIKYTEPGTGAPSSEEYVKLIHKLQQMILLHHGQWSEWTADKRSEIFTETEVFHSLDMIDSRIAGAIEK